MLVEKGKDLYPLTFNYGQKHVREIESAKYFCKKLGLADRHKIIDLSNMQTLFTASALIQQSFEIPNIESPDQRTVTILKQTVVPFRNAIFLSICVGYANSIHAREVFYGAHASDYAIYPDCRPDFFDAFNKAVKRGTDKPHPRIYAPFYNITKDRIVSMASKLGVEFDKTWSCYNGLTKPCQTCPSCVERKHAFQIAKVEDTLK